MDAPEERCRLYLITPPRLDPVAFADRLSAALDGGDVASVQLRLKDASDDEVRRAIDALRPVAQSRNVAFILNDRPDLASASGCDGVHVGKDDPDVAEARRIVGADAIVGVSAYDSRHRAMEGADDGADYVAFGAFFPTTTKIAEGHPEPEVLAWWSELMTVPCVAIGGIKVENGAVLVEAGADFLAVSSGVWDYPDGPAAAVKAFNTVIEQALARRP
ncbi:MAG TPA: thiamine phosphate synthase [Gammaproteobacteria bacterium]|nr:thiamine phosphate synthase [Gammaproteobacteria bacterium]